MLIFSTANNDLLFLYEFFSDWVGPNFILPNDNQVCLHFFTKLINSSGVCEKSLSIPVFLSKQTCFSIIQAPLEIAAIAAKSPTE